MSIDKLQDKIRKLKNPSVVEFTADISLIPGRILEQEGGNIPGFLRYYGEMLETLKETVGAVRFSYGSYSLLGSEGLTLLSELMGLARKCGYYVLLDAPVSYREKDAVQAAEVFFSEDSLFPCDGIVVCPYIGADSLKPYSDRISASGKDLFAVVRTGNKTAGQLQDLLTGSRLVQTAAADIVNRLGQSYIGRRNYSAVGCVGSAVSADSLRNLRSKYKYMFILVEGYDYSNANAKNCSYAFDAVGHGAAVCAAESILGAWKETGEEDCAACALEAAQRMKKNILRYVTVL